MRSAPSKKPAIGEVNIGSTTFGHSPVLHFSTDQSTVRRGYGRAAQTADERVTRTGGKTDPPREEVPDDGADQRAEHRRHA